jgi:hypothetical protein
MMLLLYFKCRAYVFDTAAIRLATMSHWMFLKKASMYLAAAAP